MAAALIKFTQGATVGNPGQAMKGTTGTAVTLENSNNAGVASWQFDLLYVDPRSVNFIAMDNYLSSDNGATPSVTFTPDARGSYRWQLKVWSVPNRAGNPAGVDIRVFSAPEVHGLIVPPTQIWPAPLPHPESGLPNARPNEMNFGGQSYGWAGVGEDDGLASELIRRVDAFAEIANGDNEVVAPPLAEVLAEGNTTNGTNIILSNGDAITGAPGTGGSGQDGNDAWIHGGAATEDGNGGDVLIEGGQGSGAGDKGSVVIHDVVDPSSPLDPVNLQSMTSAIAVATSTPIVTELFSPGRPSGTMQYSKVDPVTATNGNTYTLLNYTGDQPGYVSYLFLAGHKTLFNQDTRIKIYYDGEGSPTVDCPLRHFFACVYTGDTSHHFGLRAVAHNADGTQTNCVFKLPIPFTTRIKIDVVLPGSGVTSYSLWSTIQYHTGVANTWQYTRKLHVDWVVASSIAAYAETDLRSTVSAKGRLAGVYIHSDDFPGNQLPRYSGTEGPIKLYFDGTLVMESSANTDYIGPGAYAAGPAAPWELGPDAGVTYKDSNALGLIRFHWDDPLRFETSLRVTRTNGQSNNVAITSGTGSLWSTVYWYSES